MPYDRFENPLMLKKILFYGHHANNHGINIGFEHHHQKNKNENDYLEIGGIEENVSIN